MQPIVFKQEKNGTIITVREWSNRITLINKKDHTVMREVDFKDHLTALHFANGLAGNN